MLGSHLNRRDGVAPCNCIHLSTAFLGPRPNGTTRNPVLAAGRAPSTRRSRRDIRPREHEQRNRLGHGRRHRRRASDGMDSEMAARAQSRDLHIAVTGVLMMAARKAMDSEMAARRGRDSQNRAVQSAGTPN